MGLSSVAVYSWLGLVALAYAYRYLLLANLYPPDTFGFVQDPWLLSPSLIMAVVITGVRFAIYAAISKKGERFAQSQTELATPKWISTSNTDPITINHQSTNQNENNNNSSLRQRSQNSTKTSPNNSSFNDNTPLLSTLDSDSLLERVQSKETTKEHLSQMYAKLALSKNQISEIQSYRKIVMEYDMSVNKYLEVYFKLIMTVIIMSYGMCVMLFRDSAFWRPESCFLGENYYPPQVHDTPMIFYYWLSLGYHLHRSIFQFFNHARSDFWAMFLHHGTTIILILVSWCAGFCQTGCLVMFLHDNGDVWLPLAKMCGYNAWQKGKDICFAIFLSAWVQFRLYWFFKLVIYTCWVYARERYISVNPWAATGWSLLFVLQGLHVYWFMLIMKIAINRMTSGSLEDIRSDRHISSGDPKSAAKIIAQNNKVMVKD